MQELNDRPNSRPFAEIRANLTVNADLDEQPQRLNELMHRMSDSFVEKSNQLKKRTVAGKRNPSCIQSLG